MKNPFSLKKPEPALQELFAKATPAEKARVAAAAATNGEFEVRHRFHKDGSITATLWLGVKGSDSALRLVPAPDGSRGGDGDV